MQALSSVKTIIFDFGGVLINLDKQACIRAFKNLGVTEIDKYINEYSQSGLLLDLEKGLISPETFRSEVKKMTTQRLSDRQIDEAWEAFLLDIPLYKLQAIRSLRKRFRVILLSNTNKIHMDFCKNTHFAQEGLTINDYFDHCYLSYEIWMVKPSVEIFEFVLQEEGVYAKDCLFLDDGAKNIEMAEKIGIQGYLVKEHEDFRHLFATEKEKE
jgi:HAD superfamily hydrolase (TIGR01509 family)